MRVTAADIHQLISGKASPSRDSLALKVARAFADGDFTDNESAIAIDIFRLLLRDAEKSIRKTLADNLCNSPHAPHDVIIKLANDEADIAERVLQYSTVLTDDDLVSIISSTKQVFNLCAIARRSKISVRVTDSLIDANGERVLYDLLNNKGAKLSKDGLEKTWGIITNSNQLLEALVHHGELPTTIVEKMFSLVSDELKEHISSEYNLSTSTVQKFVSDAREWELLGIMPISGIARPDENESVEELAEQLAATGRLTHSLLIRSLCMGCLNLFEAGMAQMAKVPRANARILLMSGSNGFQAIYKTAGMPAVFTDGVEKLLGIALEISQYGYSKPDDFRKLVIEKIYIARYNHTVDSMGYLLSIIDGKISNTYAPEKLREAA